MVLFFSRSSIPYDERSVSARGLPLLFTKELAPVVLTQSSCRVSAARLEFTAQSQQPSFLRCALLSSLSMFVPFEMFVTFKCVAFVECIAFVVQFAKCFICVECFEECITAVKCFAIRECFAIRDCFAN